MTVKEDIALARALLDPYLSKRQVGQHLTGSQSEIDELYKRGQGCSFKETLQLRSAGLDASQIEYWATKGISQRQQPKGSGLWCDGSASIIMSRLTQQPKFGSSLTVVEQGNAKMHGHWWVIANLAVENPVVGGSFGDNAFTIDIWGALERKRRGAKVTTCVFKPAVALYDCGIDNSLTVHCTAYPPYTNDGTVTYGDEANSGGKRRKKKCYITTATCETLGRPDDCLELTTLRFFRDEILMATPQGRRDVEEYHRTADRIVEKINYESDAYRIYQEIYQKSIEPAVRAIQKREYNEAYILYREMVMELKSRFLTG